MISHPPSILVYDIGGTNLRGALYSAHPERVSRVVVRSTPSRISCPELSVEQLYAELLRMIREISNDVLAHETPAAVCIAFPGPIDRKGRVVSAPGIWGNNPSGPLEILPDLRRLWRGVPVTVCNDLTAAGYRYVQNGDESFCVVTVSTGIGSKIFINGEPQLGPGGIGGEIGHAKVLFADDAPRCDCGQTGHLQAISSGRGVLQEVRRVARTEPSTFRASLLSRKRAEPAEITNHAVAEAFHAEDPLTVRVVRECAKPLAAMLVTLHLALGLDRFVLIGGFALALGEPYRRMLAEQAETLCWDARSRWLDMIQPGGDDDLSGLLGAGRLARGALSAADPDRVR